MHAKKSGSVDTGQNFQIETNVLCTRVLFPVRAISRRIFTSRIMHARRFLEIG